MIAYLDGASFDHLYRKIRCTGIDIANLRKRIYGRELSIPLSMHHLEELMLDRRARPELRVARVKLMLSIGNFRRMVKPCEQLVGDAIRACVDGESARPWIDANLQNLISEGISDLIESDGEELNDELMSTLEEARAQRERFIADFRETMAETTDHRSDAVRPNGSDGPSATLIVARLAGQAGIAINLSSQYQATLRELTSIRAYLSAAAGYSIISGAGRRPTDYNGIVHAISAAEAAELFVSEDGVLRAALEQQLKRLAVLDLPAFLRENA